MIDNPFAVLERRINRIESLLLELKEVTALPKLNDQPDRCTLGEAISITGLSKSKLYKLTASNQIPHKRFGNRLIFSRKDLLAWVEAQTRDTSDSGEASLMLARAARRKKGGRQ